jgi:hypothetical protein
LSSVLEVSRAALMAAFTHAGCALLLSRDGRQSGRQAMSDILLAGVLLLFT